ncbi:MAG: hypothetical protein SD837_00570 [Candidatus Electrothrix scaldis]|nr:MAG: hypothetical protein SD837_00570 [Candidatus Electrothrix sp. GW3-3]
MSAQQKPHLPPLHNLNPTPHPTPPPLHIPTNVLCRNTLLIKLVQFVPMVTLGHPGNCQSIDQPITNPITEEVKAVKIFRPVRLAVF